MFGRGLLYLVTPIKEMEIHAKLTPSKIASDAEIYDSHILLLPYEPPLRWSRFFVFFQAHPGFCAGWLRSKTKPNGVTYVITYASLGPSTWLYVASIKRFVLITSGDGVKAATSTRSFRLPVFKARTKGPQSLPRFFTYHPKVQPAFFSLSPLQWADITISYAVDDPLWSGRP